MPTEERGSIGSVKPTGWHTVKYDNVDGKYLYNRCHLIGYQLSGENANTKNLITGTRYLNIQGMLPFENMVADYVKETGNHMNEIDLVIEENGTLYPLEMKKHANPQKKDMDAFDLLDKIPGTKRGPGGVICLYDRLITLKGNDRVIPINYL